MTEQKVLQLFDLIDKDGPDAALTKAKGESGSVGALLCAFAYLAKGEEDSAATSASEAESGEKALAAIAKAEAALAKGSSSALQFAEEAVKLNSSGEAKALATQALAKAKLAMTGEPADEEKALLAIKTEPAPPSDAEKTADEAVKLFAAGKRGQLYGLVTLANACLAGEEFLRCTDAVSKALDIAYSSKNKRGEAVALKTLASLNCIHSPSAKAALDSAKQAISLFVDLGDMSGKAACLLVMADIYFTSGQSGAMLKVAKEALEIYKTDVLSKKGQSDAYQAICKAKYAACDGDEANDAGCQALSLACANGNDIGKPAIVLDVCKANFRRELLDAQAGIDTAAEMCTKAGDKSSAAKTYCIAAEGFLSVGGVSECRLYAEKALELYKGLGDVKGQCSAKKALLMIYTAKRESDMEIKCAKEIVDMSTTAKDKSLEAVTALLYAGMSFRLGKMDDAGKSVKAAASAYKEAGKPFLEKLCFLQLISISQDMGELGDAARAAAQARDYFKGASNKDGELAMVLAIADVNMAQSNPDNAITVLESALALCPGTKGEGKLLVGIAKAKLAKGDGEGATKSANAAIDVFKKVKDDEGQVDAGCVLADLSDTDQAMTAVTAAVSAAETSGSKLLQGKAQTAMAKVYLKKDAGTKAYASASKGASLFAEAGELAGQAGALQIAGLGLIASGDYPEAKKEENEALTIFKYLGDLVGVAKVHEALATCYKKTGDMSGAVASAREALSLYSAGGDTKGAASAGELLSTLPGAVFSPSPPVEQPVENRLAKKSVDDLSYGRKAPNFPRISATDKAKSAVFQTPNKCLIWAKELQDNCATTTNSEFGLLITAVSKSGMGLPILVLTRGVYARPMGEMVANTEHDAEGYGIWGMIRAARQELPQVPMMLCDCTPQQSVLSIPRYLRPTENELLYYFDVKFLPRMDQVTSLYRREGSGKKDIINGRVYNPGNDRKEQPRMVRKAFKFGMPVHKLDNCWYRQVFFPVGGAYGEVPTTSPSGWMNPLNTFR